MESINIRSRLIDLALILLVMTAVVAAWAHYRYGHGLEAVIILLPSVALILAFQACVLVLRERLRRQLVRRRQIYAEYGITEK